MQQADLVLEGGGMKGIGLLGTVLRLLREGYEFPRVAGTSAGAIVAAFLATGADEERLADVMDRFDYARVPDRAPPGIPGLSEGVSLLRDAGAYEGDYIHDFIERELAALGVATFADLRRTDPGADERLADYQRYKLVVMATDVSRGRLLRLPWDYRLLDLDPDEQRVADAVRASISIPLYFEPVTIRSRDGEPTTLVDGGILSNFPIEAFDRTDGAEPRWPTLGVKVIPELPAGSAQLLPRIPRIAISALPPLQMLERVAATAIVGNDQTYVERPCVRRRAIQVDTGAVGIVEFDAPEPTRAAVRARGEEAAERFLSDWDWDAYKRDCRAASP
jgi:predicted acylesterase/phospholipase RssA